MVYLGDDTMTLRELADAVAFGRELYWTVTVNGFPEGWPGVPFSMQRLASGDLSVGVDFQGLVKTFTLFPKRSKTADPLDAELFR
jgi:hypothetical protein